MLKELIKMENCNEYKFLLNNFCIMFEKHINGVLVTLSKDGSKIRFGATEYKSYNLYDYKWYELKDEDEEDEEYYEDMSDMEKNTTLLMNTLNGCAVKDNDDFLELSRNEWRLLIVFCMDFIQGEDLSWLPGNEIILKGNILSCDKKPYHINLDKVRKMVPVFIPVSFVF